MRLLWPLAWLVLSVSANLLRAGNYSPTVPYEADSSRASRSRSALSGSTTSHNVSLGFIRLERNGTVSSSSIPAQRDKRMELPDHDIGAFYGKELPRLSEPIVPHDTAPIPEDMSTAVMKTFSSLGRRKQYSTGVAHLSGCTTMYIISRRAVYATHWWENVSFDPDPEWLGDDRTEEGIFQSTVLDMLAQGGRYHPRLDALLIEDNYIQAYLIHPMQTWHENTGDVGYPEKWEAIRNKVGELVPTLQDPARWTDIPYKALMNNDEELDERGGTAGKNLFKFDPLHIFESGAKGPLAMMWAEDRLEPYHRDQW
ncbi:hypothetical protein BDV09DRAFT_190039 [Aspergillus tetrazonus]